jgi:D-threo-aldose 1-dehydrogenase
MRHRPFGRTGLRVSELVFGGGWVGGLLIHQDDDTKLKALRRALDAGINWIDTAPSYGDGKSEEALGWLLREVDLTPYLSTKVRLDLSRLDDIPGQVEASFSQSLGRLRRDSVDLLQLHNPIASRTDEGAIGIDRVLGKGGLADALERLREQGLTKLIGITALGEAAACKEAIASGRFDSAQVYYNLLNPSAGQAMPSAWSGQDFSRLLETCREHGVAAMVIRVLAAGVLASEQRHGRENQIAEGADLPSEEVRARAVFGTLGDRFGTRAQTAIRFALANPHVACVLVGMAEIFHLEEALAAAGLGPLPKDALDQLQALCARDFDRG